MELRPHRTGAVNEIRAVNLCKLINHFQMVVHFKLTGVSDSLILHC